MSKWLKFWLELWENNHTLLVVLPCQVGNSSTYPVNMTLDNFSFKNMQCTSGPKKQPTNILKNLVSILRLN